MCDHVCETEEKLMKILHSKGDGDGRGLRGVSLLMLSSCSSKQLAQARCARSVVFSGCRRLEEMPTSHQADTH